MTRQTKRLERLFKPLCLACLVQKMQSESEVFLWLAHKQSCKLRHVPTYVSQKDGKKAIIKRARLRLYPPGFNLYRASRGVKRPEI